MHGGLCCVGGNSTRDLLIAGYPPCCQSTFAYLLQKKTKKRWDNHVGPAGGTDTASAQPVVIMCAETTQTRFLDKSRLCEQALWFTPSGCVGMTLLVVLLKTKTREALLYGAAKGPSVCKPLQWFNSLHFHLQIPHNPCSPRSSTLRLETLMSYGGFRFLPHEIFGAVNGKTFV